MWLGPMVRKCVLILFQKAFISFNYVYMYVDAVPFQVRSKVPDTYS